MFRVHFNFAFLFFALLAFPVAVHAEESPVPEPFRGFDPDSPYVINYDDLSEVLRNTVLNMGRSKRVKSAKTEAATGTRISAKVKRSTANEGNRFFFETYTKNPENRAILKNIQKSLESVPDEAPLKYFTRDEQLAYWLNLYNVTLLNEIIEVYPQRSLKKLLNGKKSLLSKKVLTVAAIPLSLNDIQFKILKENYDNNPLIMYGLYQGIIGGPNIRKRAYTAENVYDFLRENAVDFVNSNRGTYAKDENIFRVSSLYKRNEMYFDDFEKDVKEHLLKYVEGNELTRLKKATIIQPTIDDWSITDLYGSKRMIGNSAADNPAALIGAVQNSSIADDGSVITTAMAVDSANLVLKAPTVSRFSPDLLVRLKEIDLLRKEAAEKGSSVSIEDIEGENSKERNKPQGD